MISSIKQLCIVFYSIATAYHGLPRIIKKNVSCSQITAVRFTADISRLLSMQALVKSSPRCNPLFRRRKKEKKPFWMLSFVTGLMIGCHNNFVIQSYIEVWSPVYQTTITQQILKCPLFQLICWMIFVIKKKYYRSVTLYELNFIKFYYTA